jgi:hypothetical protein
MVIVINSIIRLMRVLPVPVTALRQIVEMDIRIIAKPTIRSTGIPSAKNS